MKKSNPGEKQEYAIDILMAASKDDNKLNSLNSASLVKCIHKNNIKYGNKLQKTGNFVSVCLSNSIYEVAWIRDKNVSECMVCILNFGFFNRKHHCRSCGFVICNKCSSNRRKIPTLVTLGVEIEGSRICYQCFNAKDTLQTNDDIIVGTNETNTSKVPVFVDDKLNAIFFMDFHKFKKLGRIPRRPDDTSELLIELGSIDSENSFFIFISHNWMSGGPDNDDHDKYALCVEAIKKAKKTFLTGPIDCYIWLDYSCIDQSKDPAGELKQLDKIVGACDLIITPIVDHNHASWRLEYSSDIYENYKAPNWRGTDRSYLNRAWCRVEMLYAAAVPLRKMNKNQLQTFKAGLKYSSEYGHRLHVLFGTKESNSTEKDLITLPPLQYDFLEKYRPLSGRLTIESDRVKIEILTDYIKSNDLIKFIDRDTFQGCRDSYGREHGYGTMHFVDGSVYKGQFDHGTRTGLGTFVSGAGHKYIGQYVNGNREGYGTYYYANGDEYTGSYTNNRRNGNGILTYASGSILIGNFIEGFKHGDYDFIQCIDGVEQRFKRVYVEDKLVEESEVSIISK